MLDQTKPSRRSGVDAFQPVAVPRVKRRTGHPLRLWIILFGALGLVYFLGPLRTNILLLGTDDSPERGALGRTDTIILTTIVPFRPYVGMLSIPRDLWLPIPGVGEQRINTAYFFAEAQDSGSGSRAIRATIEQNFRVPVQYYALLHMQGLVEVIDALGGVDVVLPRDLGGLTAGSHHLSGPDALALVRERYSSDDFSRMLQGQILLEATVRKMFAPGSWPQLPAVAGALYDAVETDIPIWQWPRLIFAIVRAPLFGVEARTITRDMVVPFTTSEGAQVLAPDWDLILPVVEQMFGR